MTSSPAPAQPNEILRSDNEILVSIITVVRNGAGTIRDTMESVHSQRDISAEHIIIDGASSDKTVSIIREFESDQVRWVSAPDAGIYDAMNKGIARAGGKWILFLGGDDVLADPRVLADVFQGRDIEPYTLVCGVTRSDTGRVFYPRLNWHTNFANTIHHQAVFYRRTLFDSFEYRRDVPVVADYELNFLIYHRRQAALLIDRLVSVTGTRGVSHTTSRLLAQADMFKMRAKYIGFFRNVLLFVVGIGWLFSRKLWTFLRNMWRKKSIA